MKKLLYIFLPFLLSLNLNASMCNFTHTLTELLLDETDTRIIITGKIKSIYYFKNGRMRSEIEVEKVFRGENVGKAIIVDSGSVSGFQAEELNLGARYLIVGIPLKHTRNEYRSFVCDRISGKIDKSKNKHNNNLHIVQNLQIIENYFAKKSAKFTGDVNIYRDTFLLATGKMLKGLPHRVWKHYIIYQNEYHRQNSELSYKNGKLHGKSQYFITETNPNQDKPREIFSYKNGCKKRVKYYRPTKDRVHYLSSELKYKYRKSKIIRNEIAYFSNRQIELKRQSTRYPIVHPYPSGQHPFGHWSGDFIEYYENGNLKEKGKYFRGARVGEWREFFENGVFKSQKIYEKPSLSAEDYVIYFEEGKLSARGNLVNQKKEGIWEYYHEFAKFIFAKGYFKNNSIQKIDYFNTSTGHLQKTEHYLDDMRHGTAITYFENRDTSEIIPYLYGKIHGKHLTYHTNSNLKLEEKYQHGKPYGIVKKYHASGKIAAVNTLKNAYSEWYFKEYNEDGFLLKEGSYRKGRLLIGPWTEYKTNGSIKKCLLKEPSIFDPFDYTITDYECKFYASDGSEITEEAYDKRD